MKKFGFFQCDKCIGITPCKILPNGKIVCDYCKDEVKINTFVGFIPPPPKSSSKEHRL